jgi:hypothetical protein
MERGRLIRNRFVLHKTRRTAGCISLRPLRLGEKNLGLRRLDPKCNLPVLSASNGILTAARRAVWVTIEKIT